THPHAQPVVTLRLHPAQQRRLTVEDHLGRSVLATLRRHDVAAEEITHGLHAVADAQDRDPGREQRLRGQRSAIFVHAGGTTGEHDAAVATGEHSLHGLAARNDLGINGQLTDTTGDQLGVLTAEVDDRDLVGRPHHSPTRAYRARPSFWACWKILPSVLIAGAMINSVCWSSRMLRAPTEPMHVRMAPTRLRVPSSVKAGPNRICSSEPAIPTRIRVPRGRFWCGVAIPQW